MKQYLIKFRYRDAASHGEWRTQQCICGSLAEVIEWYGLNESGVEYEIISKTSVTE